MTQNPADFPQIDSKTLRAKIEGSFTPKKFVDVPLPTDNGKRTVRGGVESRGCPSKYEGLLDMDLFKIEPGHPSYEAFAHVLEPGEGEIIVVARNPQGRPTKCTRAHLVLKGSEPPRFGRY